MLSVCKLATSLSFEKLFSLPTQQIDYDWFGERVKNPPRFVVACDPDRLFLAASIDASPWYDNNTLGQFVEGLWNKDVAEIFLTNSGAPAYQEFNLSPSGAWWSCYFSKYRKRDKDGLKTLSSVQTFSQIGSSSWRAAISIPFAELSIPVALEETTRVNVCFVLGKTKRQYLTWANIQNRDPDFHKAEDFEDVDLVSS